MATALGLGIYQWKYVQTNTNTHPQNFSCDGDGMRQLPWVFPVDGERAGVVLRAHVGPLVHLLPHNSHVCGVDSVGQRLVFVSLRLKIFASFAFFVGVWQLAHA